MKPSDLTKKAVRGYPEEDILGRPEQGWRLRLYTIIFEADTVAGRRFDQLLFLLIGLSLVVIMADSFDPWSHDYRFAFSGLEWGFTLLFTKMRDKAPSFRAGMDSADGVAVLTAFFPLPPPMISSNVKT